MNYIINGVLNFFVAAFKLAFKYWYITLPVILLLFALWLWNGWNKAEEEGANAVATDGQIRVNEAKQNSNVAGNVANQSVNAANQVRKANINSFNSNFNEARRNYCLEFPADCQ